MEEPCLPASLGDRFARGGAEGVGIVRIVDGLRRAILVGEPRRARAVEDDNFVVLLCDLLRRQRGGGARDIHQRHDTLSFQPSTRLGGGDIGLISDRQPQNLDWAAENLTPEILRGHFGRRRAASTRYVRVDARHVEE